MLVDVLVVLVVAVASLAVLMTVMRLWTAKVQGEGWLPWRVWMKRHARDANAAVGRVHPVYVELRLEV